MKHLTLSIFCLLAFLNVFSQQVVDWAFGIGGANTELIQAIASDSEGNTFITGQYNSQNLDFDHSAGQANISPMAGFDIYLAKYDVDGNFLWVKTIEALDIIAVNDLAVDASDNVWLAGVFNGTVNFDTNGNTELTADFSGDGFLARFDSNGEFETVFALVGDGLPSTSSIEFDQTGNIYLAGSLSGSSDFDPSAGTAIISNNPGGLFLAKYCPLGGYQWAWSITATGGTDVKDMAVAPNGDVVLTGLFQQTIDLDPGTGTNNQTAIGVDSYILKVNTSGVYQWGSVLTGNSLQISFGTDIADDGSIYICGQFNDEMDLDPTSGQDMATSQSGNNAFVSKLGSDGSYQWGTTISNIGDGSFIDVGALSQVGSVQLIGQFDGTITLPNSSTIMSNGGTDILSIKYSENGVFDEHLIFGGTSNEVMVTGCSEVDVLSFKVGGTYHNNIDFGPGPDIFPGPAAAGNADLFLVQYETSIVESIFETKEHTARIYPNPTRDFVRIASQENWTGFELIEPSGNTVLSGQATTSQSINVSTLSAGTYILRILDNLKTVSQGLMVKE